MGYLSLPSGWLGRWMPNGKYFRSSFIVEKRGDKEIGRADFAHHADAGDIVFDADGCFDPHAVPFESLGEVDRIIGSAVISIDGKETAFKVFVHNDSL